MTIPDDLYSNIATLGYFAIPHRDRDDQLEATFGLAAMLDFGTPEAVAVALRRLGEAFSTDAKGKRIDAPDNWITRRAFGLADKVDALAGAREERVA